MVHYYRDIEKVLRGISIVVNLAHRQNISSVFTKLIRIQYHASELLKLCYDVGVSAVSKKDGSKTKSANDNQNNSSYGQHKDNSKNTNDGNPPKQNSQPTNMHGLDNSTDNRLINNDIHTSFVTYSDNKSSRISKPDEQLVKEAQVTDNDIVSETSTSSSNTSTNATNENVTSASSSSPIPPAMNTKVNTHQSKTKMKEQSVPSTQIERVFGFGSLAAGLLFGRVKESTQSVLFGSQGNADQGSISEENANRLADSLSKMRGAALKLGQMLSLYDEDHMPSSLSNALNRVRQAADYMPKYQLEKQLVNQYGNDWKSLFEEFQSVPVAAASIGQVHWAVLNADQIIISNSNDKQAVAVKIQYPGVATSIRSDLDNLKLLIAVMNVLPKGMFIDQIIKVAKEELTVECDYELEAMHQMKYRDLVLNDPILSRNVFVPNVFPHLSHKQVLVTEFVEDAIPIDQLVSLSQEVRNQVASNILMLTVKELFEWKFIQSDPNFSNFLYQVDSNKLYCIDFGAAREYSSEFINDYIELVWAASNKDKKQIIDISIKMGFLSGDESEEMMNAHVEAGMIFGEPFGNYEAYNFANSSIVKRASQHGDIFLKQRLKAPPKETYSLHRKLAGAFLLCIRLKATISCREILEKVYMLHHSKRK